MLSNGTLNRVYMIALYAALGVGGSAFSVLAAGAAVFSSFKLLIGRLTISRQPEALAMAAAGLAYYLSGVTMIATNPGDANNYLLALERLIFLGFLPLFLQISLSDRESLRESLETGAALGAVAVAIWALVQWGLSSWAIISFRASGAPGNPGPFATTSAILLAVCLLAALRQDRTRRPLFVAACFCAAFALIMSGMRTLYTALFVLPVVMFVFWPEARLRLLNQRSIWVVTALAIALVSVSSLIIASRLGHLFSMANLSGLSPTAANSLGERIALWYCAADAFREAPFFGLGRADALALMGNCTNMLVGKPLQYSHFHNALATAAALGGIVEISAIGTLLVVPVYWCWRRRLDPDARYGIVLTLSMLTIYGLNGVTNLMLGHDIHDALFVHIMTVALVLMAAREQGSAR
ncbi:O-antigen ligase family protein [Oceaniradius stylonematis]|uniref:O-antigen ligase family protein n=1 Tax=Oceaniradius stylonematis TaxID=2184161 RepID=UPI00273F7E0D|nr:O-antigen ligase family protein [Oceaniradius stylonematis]